MLLGVPPPPQHTLFNDPSNPETRLGIGVSLPLVPAAVEFGSLFTSLPFLFILHL